MTKPQETRRTEILEAAIQVIAEKGLSATTMERVAGRAGVSPGTVTFHFARKEALLLAALDHVVALFDVARSEALAAAGDDAARALDGLAAASFAPDVYTPEKIAVWTAFWGEASARRIYMARVGPADARFHRDVMRETRRLLARAGAGRGDQATAEALARGLTGLVDSLWQEQLAAPGSIDAAGARTLIRAYLAAAFPREPLWRDAPTHEEGTRA
ncbi:MAG: TetR family transcriptional regulator [Marivibrio sp.]|uniref:TetR family transcriptional regulator n=1 Tax=Marivibrio sp. TaxID=2039719 RepID=UPI0032F01354